MNRTVRVISVPARGHSPFEEGCNVLELSSRRVQRKWLI
jgi:hypothetical protein